MSYWKPVVRPIAALLYLGSFLVLPADVNGDEPLPTTVKTRFDPQRHMLRQAAPGRCAGATVLAMASFDPDSPERDSLARLGNDVVARPGATGGSAYLQTVLGIAQDKASRACKDYENGGVAGRPDRYGAPPPELFTRMKPIRGEKYGQPIVVSINGPGFAREFPSMPGTTTPHQVVVYAASRSGNSYEFSVADPAVPDQTCKLVFNPADPYGRFWSYRYGGNTLSVKNDQIGMMPPQLSAETRQTFNTILQGLRSGWTANVIRDRTGVDRPVGPTEPELVGSVWQQGQWQFFLEPGQNLRVVGGDPQTGRATWRRSGNEVVLEWSTNLEPIRLRTYILRARVTGDTLTGTLQTSGYNPGVQIPASESPVTLTRVR